jgi:aminopeptidase N
VLLSVIETEEGSGGQASEAVILLPEEGFRARSMQYLYHEFSHLWNVPIREPSGLSPRWNEGLAEFAGVLAAEKLGDEPEGFARKLSDRFIRRFANSLAEDEHLRNTPLIEYGNEGITRYAYIQPMILFSVLADWLGEEALQGLIGGFCRQYADGASTRDWVDYFIEHGGEAGLKAFFDDWVYTVGYTKLLTPYATVDRLVAAYKHE